MRVKYKLEGLSCPVCGENISGLGNCIGNYRCREECSCGATWYEIHAEESDFLSWNDLMILTEASMKVVD